jgi:hypothetical protein
MSNRKVIQFPSQDELDEYKAKQRRVLKFVEEVGAGTRYADIINSSPTFAELYYSQFYGSKHLLCMAIAENMRIEGFFDRFKIVCRNGALISGKVKEVTTLESMPILEKYVIEFM